MSRLHTATRAVAIAAGGVILVLAAETTLHHLGTAGPAAHLMYALAAGIGVGAVAIGLAWRHGQRGMAAAIALALVAGELYGLLSTAERIIAERDAAQAPAREARQQREDARKRLTDAGEAVTAARDAIAARAAERACQTHCRHLLEDSVSKAEAERTAARAALAALPETPSAAPLADRTGLPAWALDLVQAALASIAANGLAASLIAFGAHSHAPARAPVQRGREPGAHASDRAGSFQPARESAGARPRLRVAGRDAPEVADAPADSGQTSYPSGADAARLAAFLSGDPIHALADRRSDDRIVRRTVRRSDGGSKDAGPDRPERPERPRPLPDGRKGEVLAGLLTDLALGRTVGQSDVIERYGVARSTASDWLSEWEAAGLIPARRTVGRCKVVAV